MGLMTLGAGPGTTITVEATGRQANEVVEALAALVSGRFTERTDPSCRLRKHVCGKFQIGYEGAVLLLFICVVLDPQQKRRVNCDERGRPVGELQGPPTQLRNGDGAAQETAGGSAAEGHNDRWFDDCAFELKPDFASLDLITVWPLVQAPLAAHLVLEVLHRIGYRHFRARDGGLGQSSIENPSGRSYERLAGNVLLVSRLLPDEHQTGMPSPFSRNGLRGVLIERASRAFVLGLRKLTQGGEGGRSFNVEWELWLHLIATQ